VTRRVGATVPTDSHQADWKIGLALVALAAMLAFGIGLPVSTLLVDPPANGNEAAPGLVSPAPGALGGIGADPTSDTGGDFRLPADGGPAGDPVAAGPPANDVAPGNRAPDRAVPPPVAPVPAPAPKPAPKPAKLTASYVVVAQTGPLGLLGYQGEVTISNPGEVTVSGWTVQLRVPAGELVTGAAGAGYQQNGTTVTFAPAGNGAVPPHGSVHFTFTIGGVVTGPPAGCSIDGRACS
jgi:hypothetical protein